MANKTLIKWLGQGIDVTISNKARNNSGISYLGCKGNDPVHNFSLFTADKGTAANPATLVANNTENSVFNIGVKTAKTIYTELGYAFTTSNGYFQINTQFNVSWLNGGDTSCAPSTDYSVAVPADKIAASTSAAEFWTDTTNAKITATVSSSYADVAYSASTANTYINFGDYASEIKSTSTASNTITFSNTVNINKSATVTAALTAPASPTVSPVYAADVELTGTKTFILKNAVKTVKLNGSASATSLYLIQGGEAQTIECDMVPVNPGKPYTYAFTVSTTPSSNIVTCTPNSKADAKGTITLEPTDTIGVTTLQVKSTACASGDIKSPIVTIYVSANDTQVYINCGDSYTWTLADSALTAEIESGAEYITITKSGKSLKATAKEVSGATEGSATIAIKNGTTKIQTLTVFVTHVTIEIA